MKSNHRRVFCALTLLAFILCIFGKPADCAEEKDEEQESFHPPDCMLLNYTDCLTLVVSPTTEARKQESGSLTIWKYSKHRDRVEIHVTAKEGVYTTDPGALLYVFATSFHDRTIAYELMDVKNRNDKKRRGLTDPSALRLANEKRLDDFADVFRTDYRPISTRRLQASKWHEDKDTFNRSSKEWNAREREIAKKDEESLLEALKAVNSEEAKIFKMALNQINAKILRYCASRRGNSKSAESHMMNPFSPYKHVLNRAMQLILLMHRTSSSAADVIHGAASGAGYGHEHEHEFEIPEELYGLPSLS